MYYILRNGALLVMLGGGDKSTQQSDIAKAIHLAEELSSLKDLP